MKRLLYILLYLNIYTAFFSLTNAQKLLLTVETKNKASQSLIDSLNIQKKYSNYKNLKKTSDSLVTTLNKIGFIESKLISLKKKNDSSYVALYQLGIKYQHLKIYYSEIDFTKKELRSIAKDITDTYFTLPLNTIEYSLQKLTQLKTNNGDPFARIHLDKITKKDSGTIEAFLKLESKDTRTIDHIVVKGYEKFPKSFLKYYAGIKKGNTFNKEKLLQKSNTLNTLGFVTNIKTPEILFKKDSTIVYLYLKKQKNNLFDGILGFSTNEETKKLTFNGYLNLELNNNLNYGEQFILNYKADGNDQQNFRVKVKMPYLLKSPFGVGLELKIFKRDTTFTTTDQQININYQINPVSNSYLGYKSYESNNLRNEEIIGLAVEDYKSKFVIGGASFVKFQNSSLFPIKTNLILEAEIGSREENNKKESQIRSSLLMSHIFNLNYKNSILIQSNSKLLSSDTFFTNELYRFGGINSIRGFNENSIDATFYSVLNTEYRFQFNEGTYLHSIIDVAYFENQIIALKQKLYSFGIGLGLQTRAGLLNFSIVNGNTDNQDFNFSNTKIHISIISQF